MSDTTKSSASPTHTPGPWRFRPMEIIEETQRLRVEAGLPPKDIPEHEQYYRDNNGDWIVGCEDGRVAVAAFRGKAKRGQGYSAPDPEGFANARLIAAAPELLDALKMLVCVVGGTLQGYGVLEAPIKRAEAIVSKAEGKQ